MNKVIHGDCLIESEQIVSGSVDLILTDPPFGTVEAIGNSDSINHGMKGRTAWDIPIEPKDIYTVANRILRKNGKMVLFAQEPYTNLLINKAIPNLPFCYRMMWEKDHFANSLIAKKAPVGFYEDILVFSKKYDTEKNCLQEYLLDEFRKCGKPVSFYRELCGFTGNQPYNWFSPKNDGTKQWAFPKKEYYLKMQRATAFFQKPYRELEDVDLNFRNTFNLWEGNKYKSNILKYAKDYDGYHPTQKPVLLLEDLIKTFSNEGDLVVDLTAGSGSTAIACINTGRKYIVIEKEKKYIDIINKRIAEHEQQVSFV